MEVQTDTEFIHLDTPQVRILKKCKISEKSKSFLNEMIVPFRNGKRVSILEPFSLKAIEVKRFDNKDINSPIRIIHGMNRMRMKEDGVKKQKFFSLNQKRLSSPEQLSISGKFIKNKDWISMILLQTPLLLDQQDHENCRSRSSISKSIKKLSISKSKICKGRSLFSPKSTLKPKPNTFPHSTKSQP